MIFENKSQLINSQRLDRHFFEQSTVHVAQSLIGCHIQYHEFQGIITETEAYVGYDDPACHASRGMTARTKVMFGPAGFSYVYLIYGMYHCLNIVTEQEGFPAAVLIRGIKFDSVPDKLSNGPGKLCRLLGLNLTFNNQDLINHSDFKLFASSQTIPSIATPRIGISKGQDKLWRFIAIDF